MGNEAIAVGLVEQGCRVITAYPGTPSSEILAGVLRLKHGAPDPIHAEWSTNEKVAFETALAASWTGLRAAVAMKQVGLNVAADPLFSAAYTGVVGGFLVVPADDPGPHSSQTEQDSRLVALAAKVPVFDPSTGAEARAMVGDALALSETHGLPVMLRPTTRLCHAVQEMDAPRLEATNAAAAPVRFRRDPGRWTATPKLRLALHRDLVLKLAAVEAAFEVSAWNRIVGEDAAGPVGIIASGVAFHTAQSVLAQMGLRVPILKIGTPYPLPRRLASRFVDRFDTVLVLEEPDACIELQLPRHHGVAGRLDGTVASAGELTPEVMYDVVARVLGSTGAQVPPAPGDKELEAAIESLALPARPPRLCPGCSHRSAFFALKQTFGSRAIYAGDIGCYTLGTNMRAVDTFVDMGASITMASGLYQAGCLVDDQRPIVATIGDSTFLHSGVPALVDAVHTGARFILVILDNHTTAMTGFQPTGAADSLGDGSPAPRRVSLPDLATGCGVGFVEVADPYDHPGFKAILDRALAYTRAAGGGPAVVVADRPCALMDPSAVGASKVPVDVTAECDGCRYCTSAFECPALVLAPDGSRVDVDREICVNCGQCIDACPRGFIVPGVGIAPGVEA
ncbi:MAG: thiamine pyrophosphate-dependent enzyme [Anaerolineae bacterium]